MSTESLPRVGHGDQTRKRPRSAPYVDYDNGLNSPSDEGVESVLPSSGYGDESTPDSKNGPRPKKPRIEASSPDMCTPTREICLHHSPSSPLTITPAGYSTGTPFPNRSSANNHSSRSSYSWKEGEVQYETDLDLIGGRLMFEHKTTKEVFDRFQSEVQPKLVKRLKKLAEAEAKYENDLEMADSAYLLKLLSFPNPQLQSVAKKAGEGSMLLLKGVKLMTAGRELLRAAISDMPPSAE